MNNKRLSNRQIREGKIALKKTVAEWRWLGLFCVGLSTLAIAEEQQFDPTQLEKIRGVGQGLLAAKRSYQQTPEQQQLINDVKNNKALIEALLKSQELDLTMDAAAIPGLSKPASKNILLSTLLPDSRDEKWRKKHATDIDALIVASGSLSQQMQSEQQLRQKANAKRQSNSAGSDADGDPLLGYAPPEAAAKLAGLDSHVSSAIALPQGERENALRRLSKQLTQVQGALLNSKTVTPSTPTISTRTAHRRDAGAAPANLTGELP